MSGGGAVSPPLAERKGVGLERGRESKLEQALCQAREPRQRVQAGRPRDCDRSHEPAVDQNGDASLPGENEKDLTGRKRRRSRAPSPDTSRSGSTVKRPAYANSSRRRGRVGKRYAASLSKATRPAYRSSRA